jgi:hypothetical protein
MFQKYYSAPGSTGVASALMTGIAVLLFLANTAAAQLKWDRNFADLCASPEDGHVEVRFPFVNAGSYPVTVQKLKSSCGCTTASLSKASYAPGERGEVVALFEIGNRNGFNEKNVAVTTDDPSQPSTILKFRVFIWKTVSMNPSVLFWKPDDGMTTQTIRIKVVREQPLNLVRVECSSPAWLAKLQTIKPGWEYEVNVTLLDSKRDAAGVVTVISDSPQKDPQIFRARLRIK